MILSVSRPPDFTCSEFKSSYFKMIKEKATVLLWPIFTEAVNKTYIYEASFLYIFTFILIKAGS